MQILENGNVGIGTDTPQEKLDLNGRARVCSIEITGGCDLAEPFEISEPQSIPQGSVVCIDENSPGALKRSHQPYDRRVAGIVSGAGGLNPGLLLSQDGKMDSGVHVALTGRVYAMATTFNGPIQPGDLLTTSGIEGHAMKVTDYQRAQGAIIGKAMSSLEEDTGLVLVLVTLQ